MQPHIDQETKKSAVRDSGIDRGNIMVVDDNPNNLKLLEGMLRDCGFVVRLFPSGDMALAAASANPPDLILLDIMMPEMDGYAVCAHLKANQRLSEIPVIFLSAINETTDKVKAFQVGGIDYITKPFQIEEVRARIETHLEIRRQKRLLQENFEKLQQLEALRDNLVRMIVNDMREPLTIIHGVHELLMQFDGKNLSDEGATRLRGAMKRTEDIIDLVTSLLDVSKLESGKMSLKIAKFEIGKLVGQVTSSYAEAAPKYIISPVLPEMPVYIWGDESLISRSIQNLLDNAVKCSPEGTEVRVEIRESDKSVRVSVKDQGPGIAPEYHEKIFDKFFQADGRKDSTGLGLAFCRLVVEAHKGSIGVESEVGQGSEFWLALPKQHQK